MIHPDYQYTPALIPAMASLIASGLYPCVLGSRILGGSALRGGMPWWKYVSNRVLTLIENLLLGAKLSEYHSGYRAFERSLLERLPLEENSDDFLFDNQILAQVIGLGYPVGEVSCPTRYFPEASSIGFRASVHYGFGCLRTAFRYRGAARKRKGGRPSPSRNDEPVGQVAGRSGMKRPLQLIAWGRLALAVITRRSRFAFVSSGFR